MPLKIQKGENKLIEINIDEKYNVVPDDSLVLSDGVLFDKVKFNFPESWNGYAKTAVFINDETTINIVLNDQSKLCTGHDECYIPAEMLSGGDFKISVFGVLGEK